MNDLNSKREELITQLAEIEILLSRNYLSAADPETPPSGSAVFNLVEMRMEGLTEEILESVSYLLEED